MYAHICALPISFAAQSFASLGSCPVIGYYKLISIQTYAHTYTPSYKYTYT